MGSHGSSHCMCIAGHVLVCSMCDVTVRNVVVAPWRLCAVASQATHMATRWAR